MYVLMYALTNLWRNAGRNILLGAVTFAIITAIVVGLAIFNTAVVVIHDMHDATMSAVRLVPVRQAQGAGGAVVAGAARESLVTLEMHRDFAQSEYITGADIREEAGSIHAIYYLHNPNLLDAFEADLRARGLPEDYAARPDLAAFASMAAPIESLRGLSRTFLGIICALGGVIMVVLAKIFVQERKYEIGVLRAMGMEKRTVAMGLLTEIVIITCLCFVLGLGAGALLSQPVSDMILTGQMQPGEVTTLAQRLAGATDAQPAAAVHVMISATTTLQIFGLSMILAIIASLVSIGQITKSEPVKILRERE